MTMLLKGRVSPGMFPQERAVLLTDFRGSQFTVLAQESEVLERSGQQFVRVQLLGKGEGVALVAVPGEVFGAGRYISVKNEDLVSE
jgi:hypothetical protein